MSLTDAITKINETTADVIPVGVDGAIELDVRRGKRLLSTAIAAPFVTAVVPAALSIVAFLLFGGVPAASVVVIFFGLLATILGFVAGLTASGVMMYRRGKLHGTIRERIAGRGIRANEIGWFRSEVKSAEWRSLKDIERRDVMLGDAFKETLASRLTATKIAKSAQRELSKMQKRLNRLSQLKASNADELKQEIGEDIERIKKISSEAKQMLAEAESRMQMIEASAVRGTKIADAEIALKKLNARASELPLALESAQMQREIYAELDKGLDER
ncbi:MAG TPA: hypothetical protein PKA82_12360 [Pyrinomonadaceae bacterium]|nr:hypothetical protein [Pyrinomonadaceae bacterium]